MAAVKNTMQVIDKAVKTINSFYDLTSNNIDDIYCNSDNAIDMILNAFRFGYMQGAKATKAYINKSNKTVKGVCKMNEL